MNTQTRTFGAKVISLSEYRERRQAERLRKAKRYLLTREVEAFLMKQGNGPERVKLVDVSESGLALEAPVRLVPQARSGEPVELTVRLYLSPKCFLDVAVILKNSTEEGGIARIGCELLATGAELEVFLTWKRFLDVWIKSVSEREGA